MGNVIQFPSRVHARASDNAGLKPNTAGLTSLPTAARASRKRRKFSEGISPRARQLLTADMPTPAMAAVAAAPPKVSITSSIEFSMSFNSSHTVNVSRVHKTRVDYTACELPKWHMANDDKALAQRLKITREALGLTPAKVCKTLKINPSAWSMFESGDRRITLRVAIKFCDEYGISLDWIYRADPSRLDHDVRLKIKNAA